MIMRNRSAPLAVLMSAVRGLFLMAAIFGWEETLAVTLNPGDIVVADSGAGAVIRIDPLTGEQTVVSSGGSLVSPVGIALGTNGDLLVSDLNALGGVGAVFQINPTTGTQTLITQLSSPAGVALLTNGDLLVAQSVSTGALVDVKPVSGTHSVVTSGGFLTHIMSVAVASNGTIYVSNGFGNTDVIRVDLGTGTQTSISSNQDFRLPDGITVAANGDIYLADINMSAGPGGLFRVDPLTGQQTLVSSGGSFVNPAGVAIDAVGNLVVADGSAAAIIRIDPSNGAQTILSTNGLLRTPNQLIILPGGPTNTPPTVTIARPTTGMLYPPSTNLTIVIVARAAANDGGAISNIEFFADDTKLGEATSSPGTNFWIHPALGRHTLTVVATDTHLLTTTSAVVAITVGAKNSPLGDWEVAISGADKGAQFLTFADDFSASGHGIRLKAFGLDDVSGQWSLNAKGQVTGPFVGQILGVTDWGGTLLGTAKSAKSVGGTVPTSAFGTFHWNGVPAKTFPDLSGTWTGLVTVARTSTPLSYLITSNSNAAAVFDVATSADQGIVVGQLLVTSRSKVYGYVTVDGKSITLSGTFKEAHPSLTLKGTDETAEKVLVTIFR